MLLVVVIWKTSEISEVSQVSIIFVKTILGSHWTYGKHKQIVSFLIVTAVYGHLDEPKKSSLAIFRHGQNPLCTWTGGFSSSNSKSSTWNESFYTQFFFPPCNPKIPIWKDVLD